MALPSNLSLAAFSASLSCSGQQPQLCDSKCAVLKVRDTCNDDHDDDNEKKKKDKGSVAHLSPTFSRQMHCSSCLLFLSACAVSMALLLMLTADGEDTSEHLNLDDYDNILCTCQERDIRIIFSMMLMRTMLMFLLLVMMLLLMVTMVTLNPKPILTMVMMTTARLGRASDNGSAVPTCSHVPSLERPVAETKPLRIN